MDAQTRKKEFEQYCDGLWSELPRSMREAKLEVDIRRVMTWDHDRETSPLGHESEPRFSVDVARSVDRVVQERDKNPEDRLSLATAYFEQAAQGSVVFPEPEQGPETEVKN